MAKKKSEKTPAGIPEEGLQRWYEANKRYVDLERARLFDRVEQESRQIVKLRRS